MSKIIDALEKASQEGTLEALINRVDERDTVAPPGDPAGNRSRDPATARARPEFAVLESQPEPSPESLLGIDEHLVAVHQTRTAVTERYRAVRSRIERLNEDGRIGTLAVTSTVQGEGKSLTCTNLALVMAQDRSKRVLLVDADLRRPDVHRLLRLDLSPGLSQVLHGKASLEDAVLQTPYFGLHVLTAGDAAGHPGEMLASSAFKEVVSRCRHDFDVVLFDTPPLRPISDVNFLTDAVDGVLVVVRAGKTSRSLLKEVITDALPAHKIVGTILNRADGVDGAGGYKRYGYGKGDRYGRYY